jgi:plastocyanin
VRLTGPRLRAVLFALALTGCAGSDDPRVTTRPTVVSISTSPGEALRFEPVASQILAAGPVEVTFHNRSSQAHNLVFVGEVSAASRTIVEAGGWDRIVFIPPGPGTYSFVCTIHEGMSGSLEIEVPTESIR